ncbi:hypothetical protein KPH14_007023 [Odynerus spinipes]|uniref:Uncharacterized protein n=1 Tax=Odynerus spinipes TaxID=1348599 RepID=A0AAD9RS28_9HYME|nr:hypothetical protein KPH14_007023 [Odynerus spinipes]
MHDVDVVVLAAGCLVGTQESIERRNFGIRLEKNSIPSYGHDQLSIDDPKMLVELKRFWEARPPDGLAVIGHLKFLKNAYPEGTSSYRKCFRCSRGARILEHGARYFRRRKGGHHVARSKEGVRRTRKGWRGECAEKEVTLSRSYLICSQRSRYHEAIGGFGKIKL